VASSTSPAKTDFDIASRCLRDGNIEEAVDIFARIFAADPRHSESVRHLGLIAHRIGNHDQAAELIAQAILIDPDCAEAFADLAAVLRTLGRHEFADKALATAAAMGHRRADPDATTPQSREIPDRWRQVQLAVVEPDNYPHAAGLTELVMSWSHAFAELGSRASVVRNTFSSQGVNVVFGAHLIDTPALAERLPANSVVVNLEQLRGSRLEAQPVYCDLLRRLPVWDHSRRNIVELRALTGNERVHCVGIGFVPQMQSIAPALEQPTDVLFYGSINGRRRAILSALQQAGMRVRCLYGVYGAERDRAIAEAKVVLNVHFYEDSIHEIVRTSHLLANRKAVVCECNADTEIDEDMRRAVVAKPYGELVEACIALVRDNTHRWQVERQGFEVFSRRSQSAMLAQAIADTPL
jgi:tetratricopeptide (TPR) repeat protein